MPVYCLVLSEPLCIMMFRYINEFVNCKLTFAYLGTGKQLCEMISATDPNEIPLWPVEPIYGLNFAGMDNITYIRFIYVLRQPTETELGARWDAEIAILATRE